jgi:hypothetical protein
LSRTHLVLAAGACALAVLSGCESSQDKSARLAKDAHSSIKEKAQIVGKQSSAVKVVSSEVLRVKDRAAAIVTVKNLTGRPLVQLPVAISVTGKDGRQLFTNEVPGLQQSLTQVPMVPPGKTIVWVNDQLALSAPPKALKAVVGDSTVKVPLTLPELSISKPTLHQDPVSGAVAEAKVTNTSKVVQTNLVVFGVARKGGRIVAAGRALVPKLKPGRTARISMFFVGNPKGAQLELSAPPSVLS